MGGRVRVFVSLWRRMRRRLLTAGICCAALAAAAPLPASAQAPRPGDSWQRTPRPAARRPAWRADRIVGPGGHRPAVGEHDGPADDLGARHERRARHDGHDRIHDGPRRGPPAPKPVRPSDDDTTTIILLAAIGLLLLLAAALWGAARWWAAEPMWWVRWRHATAEAGWRTSAAWAEFRDWVRLGR